MNGWMDAGMNEWMDGWIDGSKELLISDVCLEQRRKQLIVTWEWWTEIAWNEFALTKNYSWFSTL